MPVATSLTDGLRAIVGAEGVVAGPELAEYRLGAAVPQAVAFPRDESEVSRLLRVAWEEGLGVVPWGGGEHQSVGYPPSRYDLALDLRHLNRVLEYEPADMTATAQAGIRLADLQRHLEAGRQFLPLDPPLASHATLGGVLAANLSGPLRCRYGTARDLVLGIRVAHADGTVTKGGAKVVKNATGYDVTKLYVGSHGTLGVILEVTFRVYPRPVAEQAWWLPTPELQSAQAMATRILGSHIMPNRVELLDDIAGQACGSPERGPALLISFGGASEAIREQAADLARIAGELGIAATEVRTSEQTWTALCGFPWVTPRGSGGDRRAIWRGSVLPADCAKGMRAIQEVTHRWGEASMAASVAHGILRGEFRAETSEAVGWSLAAAREALGGMGGFLVVLDAPAPVRAQVDVWGPAPDGLGVMQRLKAAFDAKGILNPGRFVGGI
jgi:glycolate oxidase FAD binding subunit